MKSIDGEWQSPDARYQARLKSKQILRDLGTPVEDPTVFLSKHEMKKWIDEVVRQACIVRWLYLLMISWFFVYVNLLS